MILSVIAAMDKNRVIGNKGQMPWHISADLKRFKALTMGAALIMGRNTHNSIGRALPGRLNVIISHSVGSTPECHWVSSVEQAIFIAREYSEEVFCIGGGKIYEQVLPLADKLYLTRVDDEFEGDVFFPEVNWNEWALVSEEVMAQDKPPINFRFQVFERRRK